MSNQKPATPLPWRVQQDRLGRTRIFNPDGIECARALWKCVKTKQERDANRAYIAHSANSYPRLVEALRQMVGAMNQLDKGHHGDVVAADALLRSLGELS